MRTERFEVARAAPALASHHRRRHAGSHQLRQHGTVRWLRGLRRTAAVLAVAAAGFFAVTGGQASASRVTCGDTVTTDTTLDGDLVACQTTGS